MGDISSQIRHAVEALSTNSQNQGRRLRELLDESPAVFQQVVAAMLGSARDTPELRYVIALLSSRGLLVPMLRDLSSTDRGAAGVVAQLAQRMDPNFDRSMQRTVVSAGPQLERTRPDPEFLLGLLDALSGGLCLMPMLDPLRHSEDPKVRARMALLLGRITRAQDWFHALEQDEDPRVRANVIESLWSVGGEASSICFARGLQDPNHRVVANSLVGQYLQGDTSAVSGLVQMTRHQDAVFRAAAAWAMGRTGDTRFLPLLRQLRRGPDQDSGIVRNALHSIARINQATVAATRRESHLSRLQGGSTKGSALNVIVVAQDKEPGPLPVLKPTDWQVRANQQPVWTYQAEFIPASAALALGFVLPSAPAEDAARAPQWEIALRTIVNWRRPHDQFAASTYSESSGSHFQNSPQETLKGRFEARRAPATGLHADPLTILASTHRSTDPNDGLRHLASQFESATGDRHLILVLDAVAESRCDLADLPGLLATLQQRTIRLHCLTTGRTARSLASAFQQLSLNTGGFHLHCPEIADLSFTIQTLVATTFGHYRLQCALPEVVEQIEIELQAEGHQGKLTIPAENMVRLSQVAA